MERNSGFTLIELVIVIALFGIAAAIAVPNYLVYSTRARLQGAQTNLVADFELARSRAIRENGNVAVVFNADGLGYTVFEDFNEDFVRDSDERLLRSAELPTGVQIKIPTTITDDEMHFNSRGLPNGRFGTVELSNPNETRSVVINFVGRIRTE